MTVGERIRQTRTSLELSQAEVAKRAGYSDKTRISKIENSGNEISMKQVRRIAEALGVSTAYLMGWELEMNPMTDEELDARARRIIEYYKRLTPEMQDSIENILINSQPKP